MSDHSELAEQVAEGLEVTAAALEALHLRIDVLEASAAAPCIVCAARSTPVDSTDEPWRTTTHHPLTGEPLGTAPWYFTHDDGNPDPGAL